MQQKPFERRHERFAKHLPPTIKEEPVEVKKEPEEEDYSLPLPPEEWAKLFIPRHRLLHGR